ncbi:peroxisomal targeting signal 2 receptor [Amborella trichopoda]|uniref:Peroxin-7 n=1 Tax=Amborella trichopoda TaxID=13333 RepID=W1P5E4_AMBTC|nr:peroxisomal targeting signal 2 receptor [Amborella trichopoda]ERN05127.1 hypothetical protein AMTR_s00053p00177370 [Amborella trichopoda]|eukprot:XP_006843452.1 peroxisomal targeting signal 2 receptor [Amborella trichopoda]
MTIRSYLLCPWEGRAVRFNPHPSLPGTVAVATGFGESGTVMVCCPHPTLNQLVQVSITSFPQPVMACSWSPANEDLIASAHNGVGCICILNIRTHETQWSSFRHSSSVTSLEWDVVGRETLVSASVDSTLKLSKPCERIQCTSTLHSFPRSPIRCVTWDPSDTATFASASQDGQLKLWDARVGVHIGVLAENQPDFFCCDWGRESGSNCIATSSENGWIRVWDRRQSGRAVAAWQGHEGRAVHGVRFSPTVPNTVASYSSGSEVCMWSGVTSHARLAATYYMHTERVGGVDMNHDGEFASTASDWKLTTFSYACGGMVMQRPH